MPQKLDLTRTLVFGNSGSGKSWLAERLAAGLGRQAIDLDLIHWEPGGYAVARDKQVAIEMVRQAAAGRNWIIEGVYGWLAQEALPCATTLIWLDVDVDECLANLTSREKRRGSDSASFSELLGWAADYPRRQTSSSFTGHERLYNDFVGQKTRLFGRPDMMQFVESQLPIPVAPGTP